MSALDLERLPAALEKMSSEALKALRRIDEASMEADRVGDESILIKAIHEAGKENLREILQHLPPLFLG